LVIWPLVKKRTNPVGRRRGGEEERRRRGEGETKDISGSGKMELIFPKHQFGP
jgi:hypothetical protein